MNEDDLMDLATDEYKKLQAARKVWTWPEGYVAGFMQRENEFEHLRSELRAATAFAEMKINEIRTQRDRIMELERKAARLLGSKFPNEEYDKLLPKGTKT